MNKFFRRRLMASYLAATKNEIEVDRYLLDLAGLSPGGCGYFPRVPKWASFAKYYPRLLYSLWFFVRVFWIVGGSCIFFALQFVPLWFRCSNSRRFSLGGYHRIDGAVLGLSSRAGDLIRSETFGQIPDIWISMHWAPLRRLPDGAATVDVFSLLSRIELCRAFCFAVCATYVVFQHKRISKWVLQSYTAFRWFAVRAAVDKLSGPLIMAEHYDRWAVLVDSSVRASKKYVLPCSADQKRELVLIQHGALGGLGSSAMASDALKLPRKLGAVSRLYVYDEESERAFKRDVLTAGCIRRGLQVHYFKPTIDLTEFSSYSGLRLLMVGHPLCEALHEHVFERLHSRFDLKAYYKPHPMAPMSASMRHVGWEIIEDVAKFPVVDFLIAYPSTLVVEYEGLGIPAAVHPMNLGREDAETYMESVFQMIKSIKTERISQ